MASVRLGVRPRVAVIGLLAAAAVATAISHLKGLAANPEQFGLDLPSYVAAARRLASTGSPYSPELHAGPLENISNNIDVGYFYPPPLAQLMIPIADLPTPMLAIPWAVIQATGLVALLPVVYRQFGGVADRSHTLAIVLATLAFTPNLRAFYVGNVSGFIAILIALMLVTDAPRRALCAAGALWLKLTPGPFALGAVLDVSTRLAAIASIAGVLAVSFVLAPNAWADWIAVLPSISGLTVAPYTSNLAPAHVLSSIGLEPLGTVARVALPIAFGGLLILAAARGLGPAWVAAATAAYLVIPSTTWDHYFAVLSPVAAAVWPAATPVLRALIVVLLVLLGPLSVLDTQPLYQLLVLVLWVAFMFVAVWELANQAGGLGARTSMGRLRLLQHGET